MNLYLVIPLVVGLHTVYFDAGYMLRQIRQAESSNDYSCVGDHGKSLGAYQIQKATFEQYSKIPWEAGALDPKESTNVALLHVRAILKHCVKHHPVEISDNLKYAIVAMHYNCGINTRRSLKWWQTYTKNKVYKNL